MPEDISEPQFTTNFAGEFDVDMLNRSIEVANKLYLRSNIGSIVEEKVKDSDTEAQKKLNSKILHTSIYSVSGLSLNSKDPKHDETDVEGIDLYRYASSAMLTEASNAVRKIVTTDSTDKTILSSNVVTPLNLEERLGVDKIEAGDPFLLVRRAAEQLIEGIETELSLINVYYSIPEQRSQTSEGLEKFVNHQISKIRNYARDIELIIPILEDFSFSAEAGALKYTIKMLNRKDILEQAIRKDNQYPIVKNILTTHALLLGEKFSGNPYLFLESTGEENCLSMLLAKNTREAINAVLHITSHSQLHRNKHLIAGEEGYVKITDANAIRNTAKEGYGQSIASLTDIMAKSNSQLMKISANPFFDLAPKLESLGIPFEIAKDVESRLYLTRTERTYPDQIENLHYEEACNLVVNGGKTFISGVREVVNKTTGVKPKQTAYLMHKNKESIRWAPGISSLAYITFNNSNKDIELYREFPTNEDEITLMKRLEKFYPNHDVYARMNTGACFLFNSNHIGSIVNNLNPIIDIRDVSSTSPDKQAAKDMYMHVALHEMDHNSQIGSRIIWRHLATAIMEWACENALIHVEDENYTKPMSFRANNRVVGVKSWKDTYIDVTVANCVPALATGKMGEKYRNDSFFVTAINRGMDPLDEKNLDFNYGLLNNVKTENSLTYKLFQETLEVLEQGSAESLKQHISRLQHQDQELLSIIEHMAESFSLYAFKTVLQTTAQTDNQKASAVNRYESLKRNIVGRGEWAKTYQDIIKTVEPEDVKDALREKGMRYRPAISRIESDRIETKIAKLGFNPYEPNDAYHNMRSLERKAKDAGLTMNGLLMPMNGARALIGLRYSTQVDTYLNVIENYGSKRAFKLLLNCETFNEVQELLK